LIAFGKFLGTLMTLMTLIVMILLVDCLWQICGNADDADCYDFIG
jgi:uncharacterized membrane protein